MKYNEPKDTLSWAAWHLFSESFFDKFDSGRITLSEYSGLVDASINHVKQMLSSRSVWDIKMIWYDKIRLNRLQVIAQSLPRL